MDYISNNKAVFDAFRKDFPEFSYDSYAWELSGRTLTLSFTYGLATDEHITTKIALVFPETLSEETIKAHEHFIFRIGLIEALSYWKAHCSPTVRIMCGALSPEEVRWWHDTWYDGMGEFRYRNGLLDVTKEEWVTFVSAGDSILGNPVPARDLSGALVAFTGGKDSTLVLALMAEHFSNRTETYFIENGVPEHRGEIRSALGVEYPETLVQRSMHPRLLELNQQGALNGHTPFSIVAAFLGTCIASMRGLAAVIVGNESSANEASVPGTDINHQYSKSLQFEKRFQEYVRMIDPSAPAYFSLLRPFSEIRIASMLAQYPKVLPYLSSCNTKVRSGQWCKRCPKCLFAFMLFSAVLGHKEATHMFEGDMLQDVGNLEWLGELSGIRPVKPFECVGTVEESGAIIAKMLDSEPDLARTPLFEAFLKEQVIAPSSQAFERIRNDYSEHSMPAAFEGMLT